MARTKLSFTTCNLFNLQQAGKSLYRKTKPWTEDEYIRKIAWTTSIFRNITSDVWAFQELWSPTSLQQAIDNAEMTDRYILLAPPTHDDRKIICAAAVRKDILISEPEWINNFPEIFKLQSSGDDDQTSEISVRIDHFSRPILHFQIKPHWEEKSIEVYVCHFKSKRPTDIYGEPWYSKQIYSRHSETLGSAVSTIRRTAEAAALRLILTEQMKDTDTPVVVLGDLNDAKDSNTLNILTGQPNYIMAGYSQGGSDVDLYSVGTLREYRSQRDVYYTHIHNKTRESLDHILVSQEFYDNSRRRIWAFKGMEIYNDHLNSENHKENGSSDHGVVRASFEYRPAKRT